MIELMIAQVDMPPFKERRFQKKMIRKSNWGVVDTEDNSVRLKGSYECVVRACFLYNKEHYMEYPFVTSGSGSDGA